MDEQKKTILVVDDNPANIDVLRHILASEYRVKAAVNGELALKILTMSARPDLILLDVMMPVMDGYECCRRIKQNMALKNIPIIFVSARSEEEDEAKGFEMGAVDYIAKPVNPRIVLARVKTHLALYDQQLALEERVKERTRELAQAKDATILSLATLAEYRDNETGGHIMRTQRYVRLLAETLATHPKFKHILVPDMIDLLYKSAPLHDIGKVGIPDSILLKPGRLTPEEFEEMKKHTTYGRDAMLQAERKLGIDVQNSFLRLAREIAYTHQEKWDGSGYPEGLVGEDIPFSGRLMAVADVYDALISKRVYKPPFPHEKAVAIMKDGRGTHFDPDILDAFLSVSEKFREIALEFADHEDERRALSGEFAESSTE